MCTCIIFVFFALLEYVVVLCLIHHCSNGTKRSKPVKEMVETSVEPGPSTFVDNNGIRVTTYCNKETVETEPGAGELTAVEDNLQSPGNCKISHIIQPPSPRIIVKRRNIFTCCRRNRNPRRTSQDFKVKRYQKNLFQFGKKTDLFFFVSTSFLSFGKWQLVPVKIRGKDCHRKIVILVSIYFYSLKRVSCSRNQSRRCQWHQDIPHKSNDHSRRWKSVAARSWQPYS